MKRELTLFKIQESYGGNQGWFRDPFMNLGGCAAATACDCCIQLALSHIKTHLYPFDIQDLTKEHYIDFSNKMKPYLHPRIQGVNKLSIFTEGFTNYLRDNNELNLTPGELPGESTVEQAKAAIKQQIDKEIPIPYLLLRHKNSNFREYVWHWFLIVGYEEFQNDFMIKTSTYGHFQWFSLEELWDTGFKQKGGMIILS